MSKRPKPANAVMSRLRRPAGRLRDLPIWSKLGLIMLVPTLATIIVGVSGLVDHIEEASNAERATFLIAASSGPRSHAATGGAGASTRIAGKCRAIAAANADPRPAGNPCAKATNR